MDLHPYLEVQLAVGLFLILSRFEALHCARNRIMLLSSLILLDLQEEKRKVYAVGVMTAASVPRSSPRSAMMALKCL